MGVASGCSLQQAGVASGWNLWVWLECIGVVSGWCCKEIYRLPHIITYPYSTVLAPFCSCIPISLFILKMFFSFLFMLFLCNIANVAQRTFKIVKKIEVTQT